MTGILLALCAPSLAASVTVGPEGDFTSLDEAVHEAADGDTILIESCDDELVVIDGRELTLQAMGPEAIVGELQFLGESTVSITGLSIREGVEVEGGTISMDATRFEGRGQMSQPAMTVRDGTVTLTASTVSDWELEDGSPVQVFGGQLDIETGTFLRTAGSEGGAIRVEAGRLSVSDSSFSETRAAGAGGAISVTGGHMDLQASSFEKGQASWGGFVAMTGTAGSIQRCSFEQGIASEDGGLMTFRGATVSVAGSSFIGGSAERGGAVYIEGGSAAFQDIQSAGNVASSQGGHFAMSDTEARFLRSVIEAGASGQGGGMYQAGGDLQVDNMVISSVEWAEQGGAVYQASGTMRMSFSTVERNAAAEGAGIYAAGSSTLSGVIVSDSAVGHSVTTNATGRVEVDHSIIEGEASGEVNFGTGTQMGDPGLKAPEMGQWMPGPYSLALDSGPYGQIDPDGTPADMGAYGGPFAWSLEDRDQDGYTFGRDCDDNDPGIHEYADDVWYDGTDNDCRGNDDYDADYDGHAALQYGGTDCDDTDPMRNPDEAERNDDSRDSDCDGLLDQDLDGDRWSASVDCDDQDASVHPWADDEPYDGIDSDCVGDDDFDADGDGWRIGADCNDDDPRVSPGAAEVPDDGIDQDCDGEDPSPHLSEDAEGSSESIEPGPTYTESEAYSETVSLGCSSTSPTSTGFAAALLALAGSLLLRRRD